MTKSNNIEKTSKAVEKKLDVVPTGNETNTFVKNCIFTKSMNALLTLNVNFQHGQMSWKRRNANWKTNWDGMVARMAKSGIMVSLASSFKMIISTQELIQEWWNNNLSWNFFLWASKRFWICQEKFSSHNWSQFLLFYFFCYFNSIPQRHIVCSASCFPVYSILIQSVGFLFIAFTNISFSFLSIPEEVNV